MKIEEYISSGILEAYALNDLPPQEMKEVEEMMVKYPEIKAELNSIELAFEAMAMGAQRKPRADLKDSILDAIDDSVNDSAPEASQPESIVDKEDKAEKSKVIQLQPSPVWKYAVAASVSLALVTGYLAIDYRSKWKDSSSAYAQLLANNAQMAEQYNQVNDQLGDLEDDLAILSNPDFRRINMPGTENAQDAFANVYWNQTTEELYLNIRNLKQLAANEQYQLWAIVDGQPVDAGVFDWNVEGLVRMKNIASSGAFAVTIEPEGGSQSPNLESMQVLGTV